MFELFSDSARKVFALANQEAQRYNHEYVGTEHVALGILKEGKDGGSTAIRIICRIGADPEQITRTIQGVIKAAPDMVTMGKLPQTPRCKRVVELAMAAAREFNDNYVGTEHILLGLLGEPDGTGGMVLLNHGITIELVKAEIAKMGEATEAGVETYASVPHAAPVPWAEWVKSLPINRIAAVVVIVDAHVVDGVPIPAMELTVRAPAKTHSWKIEVPAV